MTRGMSSLLDRRSIRSPDKADDRAFILWMALAACTGGIAAALLTGRSVLFGILVGVAVVGPLMLNRHSRCSPFRAATPQARKTADNGMRD